MTMTNSNETAAQAYILPIPNGWAVITYGDPVVPDDEVLPLPYTDRMPYFEVVANFRTTPAGRGATVDGWETLAELRACEPELAELAWGAPSRRI